MGFGCDPRTLPLPGTIPADAHATLPLPSLSPVGGKPVIARCDRGSLSSDGGLLAPREVEARRVHAGTFGVYGVRKVWRQLGREGTPVARCTVARLVRPMGLRGVVRGQETRTTVPNRAVPCPSDRVNRQFLAPRPNLLWVSDCT